MKTRLLFLKLFVIFFCIGCSSNSKENGLQETEDLKSADKSLPSVMIIPKLKFDKDTIETGDSLIATLSVDFKPVLSDSQMIELVKSLSYHLDTATRTDYPKGVSDYTYTTKSMISEESVRIGFVPIHNFANEDRVIKKDISAAIKIDFPPRKGATVDCTYVQKFTYFIRNNN